MLSNEELNNIITNLKNDGVSYRFISKISGISYDSFYYYRRCRIFPIETRSKIEDALKNVFGDYINEYSR